MTQSTCRSECSSAAAALRLLSLPLLYCLEHSYKVVLSPVCGLWVLAVLKPQKRIRSFHSLNFRKSKNIISNDQADNAQDFNFYTLQSCVRHPNGNHEAEESRRRGRCRSRSSCRSSCRNSPGSWSCRPECSSAAALSERRVAETSVKSCSVSFLRHCIEHSYKVVLSGLWVLSVLISIAVIYKGLAGSEPCARSMRPLPDAGSPSSLAAAYSESTPLDYHPNQPRYAPATASWVEFE